MQTLNELLRFIEERKSEYERRRSECDDFDFCEGRLAAYRELEEVIDTMRRDPVYGTARV